MFQVVGPALGCRLGEAEPVRPGSETGAKVQDHTGQRQPERKKSLSGKRV